MDNLTKGTWIVNTAKHIEDIQTKATELNLFRTTSLAGKTGIFLSKLVADGQEIIPYEKVNNFARESSINNDIITVKSHLELLKGQDKVDYSIDALGRVKEVEVYCFSNHDAIETTANIYDSFLEDENENINLESLDETYNLPRKSTELIDRLVNNGYKEEKVNLLIQAQRTFSLVKIEDNILYNEYIFTGNESKMTKTINSLSSSKKDEIEEVIKRVSKKQGLLEDKITKDIELSVVKMMEGIGLIDGITVTSDIGEATFYTSPHIKGKGIGESEFKLSSDVFHKAKILLCCLRFGQDKSTYGRGKISTKQKMLNIIRKLNRGEWLRPCTAVGQDYKLLEIDGVVEVKYSSDGMYKMRLRQKEVGKLVEQMILNNSIDSTNNTFDIYIPEVQPSGIIIPEKRRQMIQTKECGEIKELKDEMLNILRM